jgi:hypothetical protein
LVHTRDRSEPRSVQCPVSLLLLSLAWHIKSIFIHRQGLVVLAHQITPNCKALGGDHAEGYHTCWSVKSPVCRPVAPGCETPVIDSFTSAKRRRLRECEIPLVDVEDRARGIQEANKFPSVGSRWRPKSATFDFRKGVGESCFRLRLSRRIWITNPQGGALVNGQRI